MILRLGKLCLSFGKIVVIKHNVIVIEEEVKVKVTKVVEVEEICEIPTPVIKRVPVELEMPVYTVTPIDHQLIQHKFNIAEKAYPIKIDKPVLEEVTKVVEVQKLVFDHVDVPVHKYKVIPGEETILQAPRGTVFEVTCACGNAYTTNHTKCTKCGKTTSDTLKELKDG